MALRAESQEAERRLAEVLGSTPDEVRNYLYDVLEERLWRGRKIAERVTGFRFVRGTHGGSFVRDPHGTDVVPPGVEVPPARKQP